jgi:predicted kinase
MPLSIKLLIGLPGSGKSEAAKELVEKDHTWMRVNKDSMRRMSTLAFSGAKEKAILRGEIAVAEAYLESGYNVVVDDTNLSLGVQGLWKELCTTKGYRYQEDDKRNVPLDLCIANDAKRLGEHRVGRGVIETMALRYGLIPELDENTPQVVLCDVDGTIADTEHRMHYLEEPKDYDGFFMAMDNDRPIMPVIEWLRELSKSYTILLISGRPVSYYTSTKCWLNRYKVPHARIFMRPQGDHRPDYQFKASVLKGIPKDKVFLVIDDRPSIVELVWRPNGFRVIPLTWRDWPNSEYELIAREKFDKNIAIEEVPRHDK